MTHAVDFLLAVLINSLWQAPVIAIFTWLSLRAASRNAASTRYAVWMIALFAASVLPLLTSTAVTVPAARTISTTAQNPQIATQTAAHQTTGESRRIAILSQPQSPSRTFRPQLRIERAIFSVDARVALGIVAVWLVIFAALLLRLLFNLLALEHLKRDALPLPFEYRDHLRRWNAMPKSAVDVRLCVSSQIEVPVAVGLFDAMILLPEHLLATLSPDEIDQIALHELAHLRRADDWFNALQRVLTTVYFFNPGIRWIAAQLDMEREVACDDHVVASTHEVRPYAHCLTKMAEVTSWPHTPLAAPGVFVSRKNISVRIERLLKMGANRRLGISYSAALTAIVLAIGVFICASNFAPVIAAPLAAPIVVRHTAAGPPAAVPAVIVAATTVVRCTGCNFSHVDWHGRDLRGIEMSGSNLSDADLRGADLRRADFSGANLSRVRLAGANLQGTRLEGANLSDVSLQGVDLSGALISGMNISGQSFDARTLHMLLSKCTGCSLGQVDARNMDLRGVHVSGLNLSDADFRGADLRDSVFEGVNFSGSQLRGARLDGSKFEGCNFSDVDFHGVDLSRVELTGSNLSGATMP